jgi:NADPH:quinone reductase-like Zn-dependent oxidoreductase
MAHLLLIKKPFSTNQQSKIRPFNKAAGSLYAEFCSIKISTIMKEQNLKEQVLVTGGTGFVGAHCIVQLLQQGYAVKTTVRSLARKDDVLEMLNTGGIRSCVKRFFI